MARYNGGIMGNVSGRLGNTVSSGRDGKNVIRSRNRSYNKQPTAAQSTQRILYNRAVNFWRKFPESFKELTINQWDTKLPIYQEFMKRNVGFVYPSYHLKLGMSISDGPVSNSPFQYFSKETDGNTCVFSFDPRLSECDNCQDEDEVYIFGTVMDHPIIFFPLEGIQRRDWGLDFTLFYPDTAPWGIVGIYFFWHRPSTGKNSKTRRIFCSKDSDTYYYNEWL